MVGRSALLLAALLGLPGACSVNALQGAEYNGPKNTCAGGCDGAACVDRQCRADHTSYTLLLETTPPANAHYAPEITFEERLEDGGGGARDIELPALAQVTFRVDATNVVGVNGPIALSLRLTAVDAVPGISRSTREARTQPATLEKSPAGIGVVDIAVPKGTYLVYVAPLDPGIATALPPLPLGAITLTPGPQERVLVVRDLKTFQVDVTDENGKADTLGTLDGYDVSVVDRTTGRLVSTIDHTCGHPTLARMRLSPGLTQHTYSVRFAPPPTGCSGEGTSGPLRPTYDFDLDALDVGGAGFGTVSLPSVATLTSGKLGPKTGPVPVSLLGHVRASGSSIPLVASIVFRSRKINLLPEWKTGNPYFEVRAQSVDLGEDPGGFLVRGMPSGEYDALVIPDLNSEPRYAVTLNEHVDVSLGEAELTATPKTRVSARVVSLDGTPFSLGDVEFVAASYDGSFGTALFPALARSQTLTIDRSVVDTTLDPGWYDVIARIPEASGYPWVVRKRVRVDRATTTAPSIDLHDLRVSPPVLLSGMVRDPNGDPVARATIHARALLLGADKVTALGAPEVAETTTGEDGRYQLLVPSGLLEGSAPPAPTK
ncbi:MAG: hypothetical protein NVSMB47_16760 [Polyangiales bacterium]